MSHYNIARVHTLQLVFSHGKELFFVEFDGFGDSLVNQLIDRGHIQRVKHSLNFIWVIAEVSSYL